MTCLACDFLAHGFKHMSRTQPQMMMESSVALGRLELAHSSSAGGVTSRLPGGAPPKEKPGQPPSGLQSQAHLNGCVPLSHQVAGHKYGVDKVGKSAADTTLITLHLQFLSQSHLCARLRVTSC